MKDALTPVRLKRANALRIPWGPQSMIRFTVGLMAVGDTITIDHLLSVYQDDANAVSEEGTLQKNNALSFAMCYT